MRSEKDYPTPGNVFRLNEIGLMTKLEDLVKYIPNRFDIRDTAGQHQIYLSGKANAIAFVKKHYGNSRKGIAA